MMKKGFGKGFCSGILVAALTVGLPHHHRG